ncbi:MAG: NAD(P)/FAD-dependent oxidoreductase [Microbacterium sp.]
MYDAIVIGGGPAGLQAALTLGRMHRTVLLVDSGDYRNGTVEHAHNLLTNDGVAPADLRGRARAELSQYPTVEVRDAAVETVTPADEGFTVTLAEGAQEHAARVILATGMRDELPAIPGLAQEWGRRVAQCPFCHGHEFADQPVAVAIAGEHAQMIRLMLDPVVSEVAVIDPADLAGVESQPDGLLLRMSNDSTRAVAGMFIGATARQRAPFAERLGCRVLASGGIEIDEFGRTSVPGVYAGGDMAHAATAPGPMVSLAAAIAAGQLAAVAVVRDEIAARMTPADHAV